MMMLPAFFARVNPVSTIAKPACMKNTSAAPIRNHTLNTSLVADSFTSMVISSIAIICHLLSFILRQTTDPHRTGKANSFWQSGFLLRHTRA